ncbi:hypothetical protein F4604DRAFT_1676939 [Suillus subluteus]|nr:hypothetical protein F4604DRAFT_1676939 [Suillus subluteus]
MPKQSQKVQSAIENLGSLAKKQQISVDKENSKIPVESVLSASGQIFVQLKNNGATMDLECSHTTTMDSEHNHTATMDLEHSTHLQVNANLFEESSLALQDSVDMGLESSDAESEYHESAGDCDLGLIEGFEDFNEHAATMMGLPDDNSLMDLDTTMTHPSPQTTQASCSHHENIVEDADDEGTPLCHHDTCPTAPQWHSGDFRMPPTVGAAMLALVDLRKLLYCTGLQGTWIQTS